MGSCIFPGLLLKYPPVSAGQMQADVQHEVLFQDRETRTEARMNNIPVFTAAGGTATLILKEIPHEQTAYVLARTWPEGGLLPLLQEAARFCRMAGAKTVFGSAGQPIEALPHSHDMLKMALELAQLPHLDTPVALEAVEEGNIEQFRQIYNTCFHGVTNAATYSIQEARRAAAAEQCFLALHGGQYAGIGQLDGSELRAIGVLPQFRGLGTDLAVTLLSRLPGPEAVLLVSSSNGRAMALYKRLGFRQTAVASSWYTL